MEIGPSKSEALAPQWIWTKSEAMKEWNRDLALPMMPHMFQSMSSNFLKASILMRMIQKHYKTSPLS